jgi:hypothetical protein
MLEESVSPPPEAVDDAVQRPRETLAQRVQRLEDAVAALQDTQHLEDRVYERVTERLQGKPAAAPSRAVKTMIAAERRTTEPQPATAEEPLPAAPALLPALTAPLLRPSAWLLFDLISEARTILRMFFDIRYRVAWSTYLVVLVLVPFIITSHWWVPLSGFPVVGPLIDKVVDLILAFVVFKVLSREARRYREVVAGR